MAAPRHHVVFLDRATVGADIRSPRFEHTYAEHEWTSREDLTARLARATIVITNKVRIDRAALAAAPDLVMVAVAATGVDIIDLEACDERGVVVSNVRAYGTQSVAEHVLMLALALRRQLLPYQRDLARGAWERSRSFCLLDHRMHDLEGSVMGVVGLGSIGRRTKQLAEAFGMTVLAAERRGVSAVRPDHRPFEEVLERSDVLSLHCPLDASTRGLIGKAELERMKPGAVLINTARGGLVDESSLAEALVAGRIGGAGIDVLPVEPPAPGGSPLLRLSTEDRVNLIVTPHIGWASQESMQALADQLIDNVEAFARGEPRNVVTKRRS